MAYPTQSLSVVLGEIDRTMIAIRQNMVRVRDRSAAQPITSTEIFDVVITLRNARARLMSLSQAPGLASYARDQKNDDELDVVAEFNAVTSAIDSVVSWVGTNFPRHTDNGTQYLLAQTLGPNGPVDRQFSSAALAGFRTQLNAVIATIGA